MQTRHTLLGIGVLGFLCFLSAQHFLLNDQRFYPKLAYPHFSKVNPALLATSDKKVFLSYALQLSNGDTLVVDQDILFYPYPAYYENHILRIIRSHQQQSKTFSPAIRADLLKHIQHNLDHEKQPYDKIMVCIIYRNVQEVATGRIVKKQAFPISLQ